MSESDAPTSDQTKAAKRRLGIVHGEHERAVKDNKPDSDTIPQSARRTFEHDSVLRPFGSALVNQGDAAALSSHASRSRSFPRCCRFRACIRVGNPVELRTCCRTN